MLILIAPKFHPRHSKPCVAYTDSETIPVCRYYYIIFADIIAVTATLSATIHYIYSRSLLLLAATLPSLIIFAAVIAIAAAPVHYILATARCITASVNTAIHAAAAYRRCNRCHCSLPLLPLSRIQSLLSPPPLLFEYNRYRCLQRNRRRH